ncbi:hypothetical protein HAX54_020657 [Datura stramonium]|uniref:Uncharacterized protein n=1 Tax=Datura stramonium TaxID=4076 RepID=A0ABS8S3A8_DATST|nr:hypothetical protein [Datura stramonium]
MADIESKLKSSEECIAWKRQLPGKFLSHGDLWNDEDFLPKGASEQHRDAFIQIYQRYFRQIVNSDGFDIDKYPGDAKAAVYIPYLDFEKEADMLMELANHAIDQDYNNRETSVYKYKVSYIENVNFFLAECREFFMTVKVINLTLSSAIETFQIHAYKGPHEENIVRLCRKKMLI